MKQTFTIETTHKISALELAGMLDDAGVKKYSIHAVELSDVQGQMTDMLDYVEEEYDNIYSDIADYFNFDNRTIEIEQTEIDFIKIVFSKKMQKKIFGKTF